MSSVHRGLSARLPAAGVLAVCIGASSAGSAHPVAPSAGAVRAPRPHSSSWTSPAARTGKGLLYWANGNAASITIYPSKGVNQAPIGEITDGLAFPTRLFVDKRLNLYVTDPGNDDVLVYPPGATSPSLTISVEAPVGLTVGSDGTVYVGDVLDYLITEYKRGQTTPSQTIHMGVPPENLALDAQDNLYVQYTGGSRGSGVIEFPAGSTKGTNLDLDIGSAGSLVVDRSGNIIIVDGEANGIDIFPPGQTEPSKTIAVKAGSPAALSLDKRETELYVTVALPSYAGYIVQRLRYPDGTELKNKITNTMQGQPITVSPDAVF
jgi:hypothetical protein